MGYGLLVKLCPQTRPSRDINGTYYCTLEASAPTSAVLRVMRFGELQTRPEFATSAVGEEITIIVVVEPSPYRTLLRS